ncbi:MAG: TetR family transcriptional regulator C-terminal domain-containing protein [Candidatus Sumerlaeia bacterium]|nr:TetR family transcriptional regulator C-terminal domain-containing protein [Candidatus Sumerlaeia bacterium]
MGRNKNLQTHQNLLEAGVAAFLQNGYHGTGLKEVLDSVDVPKGSFYAYFESKEEFAEAAIDFYTDCFLQEMSDITAAHSSPLLGLRAFFAKLVADFERREYRGGCLIANLAGELEGSTVCHNALKRGYQRWLEQMAALFRKGQELGEFRADVPPGELANLLMDSWEGAVLRMKVEHSTSPLNRCLSSLLEGYCRG